MYGGTGLPFILSIKCFFVKDIHTLDRVFSSILQILHVVT
jgi:hypothetical protein